MGGGNAQAAGCRRSRTIDPRSIQRSASRLPEVAACNLLPQRPRSGRRRLQLGGTVHRDLVELEALERCQASNGPNAAELGPQHDPEAGIQTRVATGMAITCKRGA